MKVAASFVPMPGRAARWLFWSAVILGVLLAIATAWLSLSAWSVRSELPELEQRLARAQEAATDVTESPLPPASDLQRLRGRVAAINQITGSGGEPLTSVLLRLENNLPDDVALIALRYQRRQGEMTAVADSSRPELLTETLQRLEGKKVFREVRLMRQTERTGGRGGVQFELRLKD